MKINLELQTENDKDLLALKALIDSLASDKVLVDRGTGPLKEFDQSKVTVWSSDEHGEMALQKVNLDKDVGDVVLNTIPKRTPVNPDPTDVEKVEAANREVVVDCGNSLSLQQNTEVVDDAKEEAEGVDTAADVSAAKKAEIQRKTKATKAANAAAKKKNAATGTKAAQADITAVTEAVIDVTTTDVEVKDASIDEALSQLDPEPPKDKPVDNAAELRKLMVEVVKAHGPKGAKTASQVVNRIAGVKDVTKIPADKFDEVKAGLLAAIKAIDDGVSPEEKPAASEPREMTQPEDVATESNPKSNDVDY